MSDEAPQSAAGVGYLGKGKAAVAIDAGDLTLAVWNIQDLGGGPGRGERHHEELKAIGNAIKKFPLCGILELKTSKNQYSAGDSAFNEVLEITLLLTDLVMSCCWTREQQYMQLPSKSLVFLPEAQLLNAGEYFRNYLYKYLNNYVTYYFGEDYTVEDDDDLIKGITHYFQDLENIANTVETSPEAISNLYAAGFSDWIEMPPFNKKVPRDWWNTATKSYPDVLLRVATLLISKGKLDNNDRQVRYILNKTGADERLTRGYKSYLVSLLEGWRFRHAQELIEKDRGFKEFQTLAAYSGHKGSWPGTFDKAKKFSRYGEVVGFVWNDSQFTLLEVKRLGGFMGRAAYVFLFEDTSQVIKFFCCLYHAPSDAPKNEDKRHKDFQHLNAELEQLNATHPEIPLFLMADLNIHTQDKKTDIHNSKSLKRAGFFLLWPQNDAWKDVLTSINSEGTPCNAYDKVLSFKGKATLVNYASQEVPICVKNKIAGEKVEVGKKREIDPDDGKTDVKKTKVEDGTVVKDEIQVDEGGELLDKNIDDIEHCPVDKLMEFPAQPTEKYYASDHKLIWAAFKI
jgi:hypothetical protein